MDFLDVEVFTVMMNFDLNMEVKLVPMLVVFSCPY
jgi:hypothetical protein